MREKQQLLYVQVNSNRITVYMNQANITEDRNN